MAEDDAGVAGSPSPLEPGPVVPAASEDSEHFALAPGSAVQGGLVLSNPPTPHVDHGRLGDDYDDEVGPPRGNRDDAEGVDLISRDLLDELGDDQRDDYYGEGRGAATPPLAGFETPSEPGTPSPRESPQRYYQHQVQSHEQSEGLMCMDQWDWKTDAPEFVPGSMKGLMDGGSQQMQVQVQPASTYQQPGGGMGGGMGGGWALPPAAQGAGRESGMGAGMGAIGGGGGGDPTRLGQLRAQFDWQLRTKGEELRDMQNRMNQLEIETAQVRASWEIERRNLVRQVGHYRAVLERYCIPIEEASTQSYAHAEEAANPGYYAPSFEPSAPSQWGVTGGDAAKGGAGAGGPGWNGAGGGAGGGGPEQGGPGANSLDAKMRQLNNLLQDGNSTKRRTSSDADQGPEGNEAAAAGYSSGSIASTLRAMFPHATIRTGKEKPEGEEEIPEDVQRERQMSERQAVPHLASAKESVADAEGRTAVETTVARLERQTGSAIDDRARRALMTLASRDAMEALNKVDELVSSQGGHCRNLSSILQSVCRKIEKRSGKSTREDEPRQERDSRVSERPERDSRADRPGREAKFDGPVKPGRRARRGDEDGDAFGSGSESDGDAVAMPKAPRRPGAVDEGDPDFERANSQGLTASQLNTPAGRRSNRSWADIGHSDDEEEGLSPMAALEEDDDHWTPRRIERVARRGFDLRRRGGDNWDLKISMGGLEPPLSEAGMERYCKWLRVRLTSIREEHGKDSLRRCRGEVDFSHNRMSNQMVWMLLETLAQHECHVALLKLFANNISQGGVLAICEFIRTNLRAEALQELHLSHNDIDDESVLELVRTLNSQKPRYPPRRPQEGTGEMVLAPVWLRLNHNRIREPDAVRRSAEGEGITICTAWDRQACGTSRCCRRDCPLIHLYSFNIQARSRKPSPPKQSQDEDPESPSTEQGASGERSRRKRNRKKKGGGGEGEGADDGGSPSKDDD